MIFPLFSIILKTIFRFFGDFFKINILFTANTIDKTGFILYNELSHKFDEVNI